MRHINDLRPVIHTQHNLLHRFVGRKNAKVRETMETALGLSEEGWDINVVTTIIQIRDQNYYDKESQIHGSGRALINQLVHLIYQFPVSLLQLTK